MKNITLKTLVLTALLLHSRATATVHYVDLNNPNPTPPFTDWSTATTSIQDAVDVSVDGDQVLVTNGIYATGGANFPWTNLTYRVVVTNAVAVQSVNGPLVTVIDGSGAVGGVYLTNGCVLSGFTITHSLNGGGVFCGSDLDADYNLLPQAARVINCQIVSNYSLSYISPGVSFAIVSNSTISKNTGHYAQGGGADNCTIFNSVISQNAGMPASFNSGAAYGSILYNCLVCSNIAHGAYSCYLNNCLVVSNSYYGTPSCWVTNCTVCGNQRGGDDNTSTIWNSIFYYNGGGGLLRGSYCCSESFGYANQSDGSITNAPMFVNMAAGDFHLASNSPCINAGNNAEVIGSTDYDGNARIVGGTVDMGAYEYQSPSSMLSYAWAQQYHLPTDGSADFADLDGDGMNNWQEWIAGTNPTNAASVLKMYSPTNRPAGLVVSWQVVSNRTYYLQRATNLVGPGAFIIIASNLTKQAKSIQFTDTTATAQAPRFYRVGVQTSP